jgi:hypothetical protein
MSDLRRHALEEYNEMYLRETHQVNQTTQANIDSKMSKNRKKKERKKRKLMATEETTEIVIQPSERQHD